MSTAALPVGTGRSRSARPAGPRLGRPVVVLLFTAVLSGCAMKADIVRLETQLAEVRRAQVRSDSVTADNLAALARSLQSLYDSLAAQSEAIARMRGDLRVELYNIQQQLVAIQELTGQSQQRLSDLRRDLDQRSAGAPAAPGGQPGAQSAAPATDTAGPGAAELLDLSIQQLRRGSPGTARAGLAELLRLYPTDPRAVDAEYFMGEAWAADQRADSAAAAYRRVTTRFPTSSRAASSWYKLGMVALAANRTEDARTAFNRVVTQFPASDEAALARERLRSLPRPR